MRFTKVFTILIAILLVLYRTTTAQVLHSTDVFVIKKHRIGVNVGLGNYTNRDDLASPLLYKGHKKIVDLSYTYKGTKNWHWVQVCIMAGELRTSSHRSSADHYYGQLQYGYARIFSSETNAKMTFWFGGIWDNMISGRYYSFTPSNYSGTPTGTAISTLNIVLLCDLLLERKQNVVFSLSVPIVGYLLRNGYAVKIYMGGVMTSLNNYQRFRFSSRYERTLSEHFKLRLSYWFFYDRYSQPRKTISVFHGLTGSISFQF